MLEQHGLTAAIFETVGDPAHRKVEGSFYAIDNTCTHRGGPLCEGEVSGEEVTCPWHGAVYNIKTGAVLGPPAPRGVARYPVRVQGSDVAVEV